AQQTMADAFVQSSGAATRLVLNAGRETVTASVTADPRARGWQRVGGGKPCDFCAMLIGRGSVYTEATSGFDAHDYCACTSEPVYR
ncbi:MAG: hypothetical protein M3445_08620, partial [Actinomycetota bacterium]|nr:hypothetical protein [Actinomycetota bacterium]